MIVRPAKVAEPTEMLFGKWTPVGPINHMLHGGPDPVNRIGILTAKDIPDMSNTPHTESDSTGGRTGTVSMPSVVY